MQTTDIVSKFFIREYYTTLHNDYKSIYQFYAPDCFMSIAMTNKVGESYFRVLFLAGVEVQWKGQGDFPSWRI